MPKFWRNLWLLLTHNVALFVGVAVQGLVLNLYLVALGYHEDFIGVISFSQTAAIGLGALPAGWLSPKLGPRRCIIIATIGLGASFILFGQLTGQIPLVLVAILSGVSMAHVFVPSGPMLMDNVLPEQRRTAFSVNFATLSLAQVGGNLIGGGVPGLVGGGDAAGYSAAMIAGGIITTAGIVALFAADDSRVTIPIVPIGPTTPQARPMRSLRRDLLASSTSTILIAAATGLIATFYNVFLREVVLAPTAAIGVVFAISSLAMGLASLNAPALARRFGTIPTICISRLATAPLAFALALMPPTFLGGGAAFVVRSMLMGVGQPLDNGYLMEIVSPRDRARVSAVRTLAWNGAWAVATGLGGVLIVTVGYSVVFMAAGVLTVASAAVNWLAFRERSVAVRPA